MSQAKGLTNGASESKFDPNFTRNVIEATGPKCTPRFRQLMTGFIQHIHDFARENELTTEEWMQAVDFINEAGQMSDDRRNETQLLCDVIGLESLVDEITYKLAADAADQPTATAILGPFWRKDAPLLQMGESVVMKEMSGGDRTWMHGTVTDFKTGKPVGGAEIDLWQAAPNGLYEQQDPDQPDFNLRGRFVTGPDGTYSFYCLRPTPYPVPNDGPGGKLLELLDRHPMRPAHIHFILTAPGYRPVVTQIFDRLDKYCVDDAVFAVKASLIVDFLPTKGNDKAEFELLYDFKMATYEDVHQNGATGATEDSTAT